jgi:hypothetical protein
VGSARKDPSAEIVYVEHALDGHQGHFWESKRRNLYGGRRLFFVGSDCQLH